MSSLELLRLFKNQSVTLALLLGLNLGLIMIQPKFGVMSFCVAGFMFYNWFVQSQKTSPLWITLEPKKYMWPQLLGVVTGLVILVTALCANYADALTDDVRFTMMLASALYTFGFMLVQYEALTSKKTLGYYVLAIVCTYIFANAYIYLVVSTFALQTTVYGFMRRREVWSPGIQPWQSNRATQI